MGTIPHLHGMRLILLLSVDQNLRILRLRQKRQHTGFRPFSLQCGQIHRKGFIPQHIDQDRIPVAVVGHSDLVFAFLCGNLHPGRHHKELLIVQIQIAAVKKVGVFQYHGAVAGVYAHGQDIVIQDPDRKLISCLDLSQPDAFVSVVYRHLFR